MASDIFDWDEEEEKKAREDDVWGAYPLAQPPGIPDPTPDPPAQPTSPPIVVPDPDPWNEIETVMRPSPEPWPNYHGYEQPEPPQDQWIGYPGEQLEQPAAAEPGVWSEYPPDSPEETARKGGLAWSAGIVFFSSVAFMLFLGWIADWLFGSSPWGLIGGIVLGSIVGFIQFFRISSRIFNPTRSDNAERPLMTRDDEHV